MGSLQQSDHRLAGGVSPRKTGYPVRRVLSASKDDLQVRLPPECEQRLAQSFRLDSKRGDVIEGPGKCGG